MHSRAFVSLYGVFLLAFLGACVGTFFVLSPNGAISHIFAHTQAKLHAKSMSEIALLCIREFGANECGAQRAQFGAFEARANVTQQGELLFLDVSVQVRNPVTSNLQNLTQRYIVLRR